MTPLFLNPPPSSFPKEEHHLQLFLSPNQASDRLSGSAFFNSTQGDDHQTVLLSKPEGYSQQDHKVNKYINHPGGACSSSSHQSFCKIDEDGSQSSTDYGSSTKWMSSKMRLMRKMMITQMDNKPSKATENVENHLLHENNNRIIIPSNNNNSSISSSNHVRVCADCNTTTTPLWRSGPRGPKSLCNACGIRQRKARRAMEAAAAAENSAAVATEAPSMKIKVQNKEKKWRTSHVGQYKKQCKLSDNNSTPPEKLCFKDFALSLSKNSAFGRVFPRDEEEAAILLMELSCGLLHG